VVSGVAQRWEMGVQRHYKNLLQKKSCRKVFNKKFDQKSKTDFFLDFVLSRFWAFLGEGSSKTPHKKYQQKKNRTLFLFWPLTWS
jgi:hypothetical protein